METRHHATCVAALLAALSLALPARGAAAAPESATISASGPLRFEERLICGDGKYIYGIAVADLDRDGFLDLTCADVRVKELRWYRNDGHGNLTAQAVYEDPTEPPAYLERHAIGDVNGDGLPDIVIVLNRVGHVLWFENPGRLTEGAIWQRHVVTESLLRAYDVALADFDGDGDLDIAASAFRGDCFAWLENPGPAGLAQPWPQYVFDTNVANTRTIEAGDINRDGKADLLGTATYGNLTAWYENTGEAAEKRFRRHVIDAQTVQPTHGHLADLDGDGDLDVVMACGMRAKRDATDSHQVVWYENAGAPGDGSRWEKHLIGELLYGFEAVAADLNGDGHLDVVATGCNGGEENEGEVCWFENPGEPRGPWARHSIKPLRGATQVVTMDLDKDGRLDVAAATETGTLRWWRNLAPTPPADPPAQPAAAPAEAPEALDIGSRRELFVDGFLIASMQGVTRALHSPQPRDVAVRFDAPWDGACSLYVSVFQDGDRFRMYYRGLPVAKPLVGVSQEEYWKWILGSAVGKAVTCYAESPDGIRWEKPNLGLFPCARSGRNDTNIVLTPNEKWPNVTDNLRVFKDSNPHCPPEARYKALGRQFLPGGDPRGHGGVLAFQSADGLHWLLLQDTVLFEEQGHAFDGENLAFWDPLRGAYVEYHRKFRDQPGHPMHGYRDIRTSTSTDFIHWGPQQFIEYGAAPGEHFNHFSVFPYYRAPHIYLALGERLVESRDDFENHPASGVSDAVFLSSRDGLNFDRSFLEGWIRPGLDVKNWIHCGVSVAWGLLQTGPEELSVYWMQNYYQPERVSYLQRGVLRLDGFVSVNASYTGGEFTTKPLRFAGRELAINYSTSAVGFVRVEVQDAAGTPIAGFGLEQCPDIYGDRIEHVVSWKGGADLSALAGKPVRLRFVMKDADLYALCFRP
jgi:hypothetical protein